MADLGDKAKERFLRETQPPEVDGVKIDWSPLPHPAIRDLRGMRFGKLIVKAYSYTREQANGIPCVYWKCQCDCGGESDISRDHLVRTGTKSCGCLSVTGKKGRDNAQKTQQKYSHYRKRMRHGLPPVPPTEVIGDPADVFAYDSLMAYACLRWAGYIPAAHHHLIARYLEKVEKGKIKRLMIFLPPRHGKSMIISEFFPAWYLGRNPDKRIIATSYGQELASDFGRKVRNQIADPIYSGIFPGVGLSGDSAAADKFDLAPPHRGGYFAVGAGGAITGRGANCLAANTWIETDRGFMRIKDVAEKSASMEINVLSYNHEQQRLEYQKVVASKKTTKVGGISILLGNEIVLTGTYDHLIWNHYRKTYTPFSEVKNFDNKDCLLSKELVSVRIEGIDERTNEQFDFYDLQVERNHNFFANGVLVHNCLIIDDILKGAEEADSDSHRRKLIDWYTSVAYTRLMDDGAVILVMTRWNVEDLAGWLLKEHKHEKWTVLNLPAINEKGEALWPEKFPIEALQGIRKTLPARHWEALYQQRPFIDEGGIFKRAWWKLWPDTKPIPECEFIIQSYDTAFSDKELKTSDYSARVTLGVFRRPDDECHSVILLEAWKDRLDYADLRKEAVKSYQDYEPDKVIIEKKASGQSLIQDLRRAGLPISSYTPEKNKVTRAYMAQALLENGRVYYPSRQWAEDFISSLATFPQGAHDDEADAFSQAIIWLQQSFLVTHSEDAKRRKQEGWEDEEDDLPENVVRLRPKNQNESRKKAAYG